MFYAGEYDSSSISENHFRDNRCLEKVRCLGMFSHTISLKTRNEEEWVKPELGVKTAGKRTPLWELGASELRIYKAFSVC